jgi:hypothetical protein
MRSHPSVLPRRPVRTLVPWLVLAAASLASFAHARQGTPGSSSMERLTVTVDLGAVRHTMSGGIGASMHAIETPIDGHAGSAWGANPHPDDEARWRELMAHAEWLGLDWSRVEIEQRMYQPERDRFTWDSHDMRVLYRILDWADANQVDVFLQQMWQNVRWNAYPAFQSAQRDWLRSAPADVEAFAEGFAAMAEHLVKTKGYRSIKYFCITNEPGWNWSWWQVPPGTPTSITPGLEAVRHALDRRGIDVPLSAPDWTDLPPLYPVNIDYDHLIGAYDIHSYYARPDWHEGDGYPLSQGLARLRDWIGWAHARGKPLFLSEMGTMAFGWRGSDPGPGTWAAGMKDAVLAVEALNLGADALNRWSFVNRGNLDGQWQLVDTWHPEENRLLDRFTPHPNAYYTFGLFPRFSAPRSRIGTTTVTGGVMDGHRRVFAAGLTSPRGDATVFLVNDASSPFDATLSIAGVGEGRRLYRYQVTEAAHKDQADVALAPVALDGWSPGTAFGITVPARSITVLSTTRLEPRDPGMKAEGR